MIQPTNAQQLYPQQGGANAVSINIYNPQAYGAGASATPQACATTPYNYTNSLYQMPQNSAYAPVATQIQPEAYQQYMPFQNPVAQEQTQLVAPAPQMMPESVMNQNIQQPVNLEQPAVAEQQQVVQPEVVEAPQENVQTINTDELVQGLKSADADVKAKTINDIATFAQEAPEVSLQVVSEPIMNALVDVIKEDTTGLEGPTEQQIAVAEKITKGEQLTPEEDALAEQLSPRDKANKNRIFALYTLAMIQKLQRDELNEYIATQKANGQETIAPLKMEDLIGYNEVVNVIKNDARPEVKVAAIQALQHVAEAQDKAGVETVLADSLKSQDEAVKQAAEETMSKFQGQAA